MQHDARSFYHSRDTHSGRGRLLLATGIVLLLVVTDIVSHGIVRSSVRAGVSTVTSALREIGAHIAQNGYFASHAALAHENQSLQAEVAALQERAALATALQAQVDALSNIDHLVTSDPGITAPVVSSSLASPYGTFLIGAGTVDGITVGSTVLSTQGTVVGTVSDAGGHTSTVLEIFAPGRAINALLDGVALSVKGKGGGNASALVPHGLSIAVGDAVISPTLGERPIGIVGHVDNDPSSAAIQVYIGSIVNLDALRYVFVVPPIRSDSSAPKK
ncbi:MAG TPA: rod shape-determining protein MreC [Candidatus Paceibacterota bacterium]|nr:rod shape-determining protein MreC [Candidatus Paceibacterota bacterium]